VARPTREEKGVNTISRGQYLAKGRCQAKAKKDGKIGRGKEKSVVRQVKRGTEAWGTGGM